MARSKVPKFGVWEGGENVAFTAQFETVRTGVGGPIINPNDFQANQGVLSPPPPPPQQTKPKQKQPAFGAWDEEEEVPYTLYFENQGKAKASPSEPQMNYNVVPTQPLKTSPVVKAGRGSEMRKPNDSHQPNGGRGMSAAKPQGVKFIDGGLSNKQSLRHPEATGRGWGSSPIDNNRGAPVGTRQRPHATAGPSPGRAGATVPVFGDWNNNPSQADGYTVVFNKLQEDRRNGNVEISPSRSHYSPGRPNKKPKQGGCFSWLFG